MATITAHTHAKDFAPRDAGLAASWFAALLRWFGKTSERRIEASDVTTRIRQAARVRAFAQQVISQDPRFASDLFAAADRHERE